MICLKCGQTLQFNAKKSLYICPNCLELFSPEEIDQGKIDQDDISIMNTFPSVIAHEYTRIIDLMNNNQLYGAVLQCKDLFEVILKFPVLLSIAELYSKEEKTPDEGTVVFQLLQNHLSLGHWVSIARDYLLNEKKNIHFNKNIKELLIGVMQLYQTYNFTGWRNDTIGHGALKMDQEGYKRDLVKILELIQSHFNQYKENYQRIILYTKVNERKNELNGEKKAANVEFEIPHIFIESDGKEICLFPFFFLFDKSIYFFDSYDLKQKRTAILNYPLGLKKTEKIQDLTNTFVRLKEMLAKQLIYELFQEKSIEDEITTKDEDSLLDSFLSKKNLLTPHYIERELRERMSLFNNETGLDRGIILLSMEAGMGKTTFTKIADELQFNMSELRHKITIRSFSINDTNSQNINKFRQSVEEELLSIRKKEKITKMVFTYETPLRFENNAIPIKEQFAKILNYYSSKHRQQNRSKDGLLFIIDGIDEVKPDEGETIFDYIPERDLLEEGIFILLTSRTGDQDALSHFTKEKLRQIKVDHHISVHRQNENYINFLQQYLNAKLKIQDPNIMGEMLKNADYRMLNIPMLSTLSLNNFDFCKIEKQTDIIKEYLRLLENMYSPKFFSFMKRILIIAATANESLTLKEISFLLGEKRISFTLLGYINDLKEILTMEKNAYRGNVFTISHQDVKEYILEIFKEEVKHFRNEWVSHLLSQTDVRIVQPEEIYIYSNIFSDNLEDELFSHFPIDKLYDKLYELTVGLLDKSFPETEHIIIRWMSLIKSQIHYWESSKKHQEANLGKLISLYVYHARFVTEFSLDQSFQSFTKAVNYYKEIQKVSRPVFNPKHVFEAFAGRSMKALFALSNHLDSPEYSRNNVLRYIDELKSINKELFDESSKDYTINHTQTLYQLGLFHAAASREKSYPYYHEIINLYEKYKEGFDHSLVVSSYRNLAFSYYQDGSFSKALDYINKAIPIHEGISKTQLDKLHYANMLLIRSGIFRDSADYQDIQASYRDIQEAQKIINQLRYEGFPVNWNDLIKLYMHIIAYYLDLNHVGNAFDQYCQLAEKIGLLEKNKEGNLSRFASLVSGIGMGNLQEKTSPIFTSLMNVRLNKIIEHYKKDYQLEFTGIIEGFQRQPIRNQYIHSKKTSMKKKRKKSRTK